MWGIVSGGGLGRGVVVVIEGNLSRLVCGLLWGLEVCKVNSCSAVMTPSNSAVLLV